MKIIYELNGNVHVMVPVLDCGLTIEQIAAKDVPSGIPFHIVEDSAIPISREHRNEWKLNGKTIEIDQVKLAVKLSKLTQKSAARLAILSKLNISEDELKEIIR